MKNKLVGFMGAPGCGKTTLACAMKEYAMENNVSGDVCTEYPREYCFKYGPPSHPFAQYRITANQTDRENALLMGNNEYIFTDSPVWFGYVYTLVYMNLNYNEEVLSCLGDIYTRFVVNNIRRYHKVFYLQNDNPHDDGCRNMEINQKIADVMEGFYLSHQHILPIIKIEIDVSKTLERKKAVWHHLTV